MQSPLEAVRNERQWHQWVLNHWALAATFGQSISLRFFWLDARDRLCPRAVHGLCVTAWNSLKRSCNSVSQETNAIKACLMSFRNFMNVMWLQRDCYIDCLYIKNVMARWHRKKLISCSVDVFGKHALLRCADFGKEFEGISAKAATCRPPLWPQTVYIRPNSSESVRIRPNPSLQVLQKPFDHLICGPTEIDWGCHLEGEKNRHRLSKLNGLALPQFRARWPWHITCNQMFIIFYIILLWSSYSSWNAAVSRSLMGAECARANELVQCPVWKRSKRMQWPLFQHQAQESGEASYLEIRIITIVFFECFVCFRYSTVILLYIVHSSWMFIANLMNSAMDGLKGINK